MLAALPGPAGPCPTLVVVIVVVLVAAAQRVRAFALAFAELDTRQLAVISPELVGKAVGRAQRRPGR